MPQVLDPHRPTLPELLTRRLGRTARRAALVVGALLIVGLAAIALLPEDDGIDVVFEQSPPFNLRYTERLERVTPQGNEVFRLLARRGDLFVQSFAVAPLEIGPYRGEVVARLAVLGAREIEALRARFAEFELVQDGKTRVNEVSGYGILFRARLGTRRLFGRQILLPEPTPGARRGARLTLLATPAGGVARPAEVGVRGVIKRPYTTFRFGTKKP